MFKIKGLRWYMISLIMLGSMINYLTRSSLSVAAPTLETELGITEEKFGWIVFVFQGAIMLQPICGYVLDVIGLRYGYALFAICWSLISMAHGFATNWINLAALRGMLGFVEGSANPAGMKATSEWFPAKERGLAGGLYNIGASFGGVFAAPLVGWAIIQYNWKVAFLITGLLGITWVVLWLLFYESPSKHKALSTEEAEYIAKGQEGYLQGDGSKPNIWSILSTRNFWGIALPRFLADPTWGTLSFWMPFYLTKTHGWELKDIALYAWMPFIAADIGCIFGGTFSLWMQKTFKFTVVDARRASFTLGAFLMLAVGAIALVENQVAAVALLCLAGFAHQTLSVTVITMASDLFKKNEVATVAGLAGTFGNAGLALFSIAIGTLVASIGYGPFFVMLGLLDIVGAVILWTVVQDPEKHPKARAA